MGIFLRIAWRNILRHKRRSFLVIITVAFGLGFSVFMRAMMEGTWDRMIVDAVELNTGYLQIHKKGYQDNEILGYTFKNYPALEEVIKKIAGVEAATKRIESAGLVSLGKDTAGSFIIGIQPKLEKKFTSLAGTIEKGRWFSLGGSKEALFSEGLAKRLNAGIGDEVAILTQDYYGSLGADLYKISGIFKTGKPQLDFGTVFIRYKDAQTLMDAKNRVSRYLIWIGGLDKLGSVEKKLKTLLPEEEYEVLTWDKIIPEVLQLIAFDSIAANILLLMLLVVVLTAVFNTIFTSVVERMKEFGMMFALGAKPRQIAGLIFAETIILTSMGIILGSLGGGAFSLYYSTTPVTIFGHPEGWQSIGFSPVFYCKLTATNIILLSSAVMGMGLVGSIYPVRLVLKSKPVEMLRFI